MARVAQLEEENRQLKGELNQRAKDLPAQAPRSHLAHLPSHGSIRPSAGVIVFAVLVTIGSVLASLWTVWRR